MSLVIGPEPPDQPDLVPLFAASEAFSAALYPPESNHVVAPDTLVLSRASLLVARLAGRPVGCGAIVRHPGYAEIKRMFVTNAARGTGVGRAILLALECAAAVGDSRLIRLETGIHSTGALRLYRAAGYVERGPFGAYRPDPLSVFMEKPLPSSP